MSNNNIKPVHPPWAKPGCTVLDTWEKEIKSGDAIGLSKWVRYTTHSGSEQECMMWVRWRYE